MEDSKMTLEELREIQRTANKKIEELIQQVAQAKKKYFHDNNPFKIGDRLEVGDRLELFIFDHKTHTAVVKGFSEDGNPILNRIREDGFEAFEIDYQSWIGLTFKII